MTRNGRFRGSTARTFLAEARRRPNLRIETKAVATRLLFEGRRCIGVAYRQRGADQRVLAAREVVVAWRNRRFESVPLQRRVGRIVHVRSHRRVSKGRVGPPPDP
ncbi:MAG: GMC family oxidoreductase N-terminal domain-containing protein [Alphaproteobacteria bacterium]|nr:GMC family oxidoreductase N-terminal domain-containing protein [Alphaproteobacteria bacterium]